LYIVCALLATPVYFKIQFNNCIKIVLKSSLILSGIKIKILGKFANSQGIFLQDCNRHPG